MAGFKDFGILFSQRATTPATPVAGKVIFYALNDGSLMGMGSDGIPFRVDNVVVEALVHSVSANLQSEIDAIEISLDTFNSTLVSVSGQLQSNIDAEASARAAADTALHSRVNTVSGGLATEITNRIAGDASLQSQIDSLSAASGEGADAVYATLVAVSGNLQGQIDSLNSVVVATSGILQSEIDDVAFDLATEISDRTAADISLDSDISAESSARAAADILQQSTLVSVSGQLQFNITTVANDLTTEIADRTAADLALHTELVSVSGVLQSNVDAEALARANADTALHSRVNVVSAGLATEIADRIAGDASVTAFVNVVSGNLSIAIADVAADVESVTTDLATNYYDKTVSDSLFVHLTGDESIAGVKTFTNNMFAGANLTVIGDFNVLGTTTTVSSQNLVITDNVITVNSGEISAGVTLGKAGITVDRGLAADANLVFNETNDKWQVGLGDITAAFTDLALITDVQDLRVEVNNVTGNLQSQIDAINAVSLSGADYLEALIVSVSGDLQQQIDDNYAILVGVSGTLATADSVETAARIAGDDFLHNEMVSVSGNLQANIDQEVADRVAADLVINSTILSVSADVVLETNNRVAADIAMMATIVGVSGALQSEIDAVEASVVALQIYVDNASASLAGNIAGEAVARAAADTALHSRVNTVSGDLATEIVNRAAADTALHSRVNTVSAGLATEITDRIAGDALNHSELVSVSGALQAEIVAISAGLGTILQGNVSCTTTEVLYTISHATVDPLLSFPQVSLTVPNSGSALYVQGITNRSATSFDVVLSGTPETSGYSINWNMNLSGSAYIIKANPVVTLVDGPTLTANSSLGEIFDVTITANRTVAAPLNPVDGHKLKYRVKQGGAGSFTLTWNAIFYATTSVPLDAPSTAVGKVTHYLFEYDASRTHWRLLAVAADD
jgi:hypothetical protein